MRFNSSVVNNFVIAYGEKKRKKHVNIIMNFTNYLVSNGSFFHFCKVVCCLSIKKILLPTTGLTKIKVH